MYSDVNYKKFHMQIWWLLILMIQLYNYHDTQSSKYLSSAYQLVNTCYIIVNWLNWGQSVHIYTLHTLLAIFISNINYIMF